MLRGSLSQQLDYHCSLSYPTDIEESAKFLDCELWSLFESICGFSVPQGDAGLGWECVPCLMAHVPPSLQGRSFQSQAVRLPVKQGGLGLRSIRESCLPAFIGSVEMSLPHLGGPQGICPVLSRVIGERTTDPDRWAVLISSGSRTVYEFARAWDSLKAEATDSSSTSA